jgi:nucleoside-diphosphate-sugar epimerase
MSTRRVLLFGASGFVGRPISAALARESRVGEVVRVSRRERSGPGWARHDLVSDSTEQLRQLLRDTAPDVVISSVGKLAGRVDELVAANVLSTSRLLDAVATECPAARLAVLGSAAEYGVVPVEYSVAEDAPTNPVSPYGVTKLAGTQLVRLAAEDHRVDAVALRVFNPIGPGTPVENMLGRAAARMRTAVENGHDHIELGALNAYRDFVDVRDVATAVVSAALADHLEHPVLNVGRGVAVCSREAVKTLSEVAGFVGEVRESAPAPTRSRDVHWIAANVEKVRTTVGWTPVHDLRASVEALWADAAANE